MPTLLGLGLLAVALPALIRGQIGWARISRPKTAVVTMSIGIVVGVGVGACGVGGVVTPQPPSGTGADSATPTAPFSPPATSTKAATAPKASASPSSKSPGAAGGNTVAAPGPVDSSVWDALAQCESSGNWATNTGNGLYGGLQLDRGAWLSNGGAAYAPLPSDATRQQQILIAEKMRADRGWSPWSSCARKLGLL